MKKWFVLQIGGQKWTVYLVGPGSKKLNAPGESSRGACYPHDCKIYIDSTLGEEARHDALVHELLHAILAVSGAWQQFKGETKDETEKAEEDAVGALTPVLHRLLSDMAFQFPKGPCA